MLCAPRRRPDGPPRLTIDRARDGSPLFLFSESDGQNPAEGVDMPELWRRLPTFVSQAKSKVIGHLKHETGSKHVMSTLRVLQRQKVVEVIRKDERVIQVQRPAQKIQR